MHKQSTIASAGLCAGLLVFAALSASAEWTLNDARTQLTDGNWKLTVTADGQNLTVTGMTAGSGDLDLSDVENDTAGYKVVAIGAAAFNRKTGLTSFRAPDVTSIANGAGSNSGPFLGCTGLTTVSVVAATTIGNRAFQGCSKLVDVSIGAATMIGDYAFSSCSVLTNVEFGAGLTSIGAYAFARTSSQDRCVVKTIRPTTLPALVSIGEKAFFGARGSNLEGDLHFPALTDLGKQAFESSQVTSFRAPSLTYLGDQVFCGSPYLTNVEVSAGLTSIGAKVFARTSTYQTCPLQTFKPTTLPALVSIGAQAFFGASGSALQGDFLCPVLTNLGSQAVWSSKITSFRAPSLTYLGDKAFNACPNLTNVEVSAGLTYIGADAFSRTATYEVSYLKSFQPTTLPALGSIGAQAFFGNWGSNLEGDFYCPALTNLGASAFNRAQITSFRAPRLKDVAANAFRYCSGLTNVIIRGGGMLGNYCINGTTADGAIINVLGAAPTSIGTAAIANSGNHAYPQVRVAHTRDVDGWETLEGVTFTPFEIAKDNATYKKYLGDTPEKRTRGLITGRGTFWLVDNDHSRQTFVILQ